MCEDGAHEMGADFKACVTMEGIFMLVVACSVWWPNMTETMSRLLYAYQLRSAPL